MVKIVEKAYAKINLYLDIESRRDDGYHNIISLMQAVSLFDEISLTSIGGDEIVVLCNIEEIPCDRRNLVYRAAEGFFKSYGKKAGVEIKLEKHIPFAAGLGGGSSDAAAVLRGLNRMFGNVFSLDELCRIGADVGADVPFCIIGGCAEVRGIGDVLVPMPIMSECYIVISCAGKGINTPQAYGKLDEKYNNFENRLPLDDYKSIKESLACSELGDMCNSMFNIFEYVVLPEHFEASDIKSKMISEGALAAMMSGSGPSVFGIFEDEKKAFEISDKLTRCGYSAYVCRPVK